MKTYIFLITGFEEIEALATVDILRRGGMDVATVSLTDSLAVTGSHSITVVADIMFGELDPAAAELLILPGGTVRINEHDGLKELLIRHYDANRRIAAICAAPIVLGGLGLLRGKKATCYPGFEKYLHGAILTDAPVVVDGLITTGKGPGQTIPFALEIIRQAVSSEKAAQVAHDLTVV